MSEKKGFWSKLKFWKKDEEEEPDDVIGYLVKGKPPDGRWKQIAKFKPDEFEQVDSPDKIDDPAPGWSYKLVEVLDERGTEGETIWVLKSGIDQDQLQKMIEQKLSNQQQRGASGGLQQLDQLHQALLEIDEVASKLNEVGDTADKISQMFGRGRTSGDGEQSLPSPQYDGKLPMWMHPQVQNSVERYVDNIADTFTKKINENVIKANKGKKTQEIDNKFDEVLESENEEQNQRKSRSGKVENARKRLSKKKEEELERLLGE